MHHKIRIIYYNVFSHIYDAFVRLHSRDQGGKLREYLADTAPIKEGNKVLDLCTGTGTFLANLARKTVKTGLVMGVDFSRGMLKQAHAKYEAEERIKLVEADVSSLPYKESVFNCVTCSHAFYELSGEKAEKCLEEVVRVLRPEGHFLMMEHDIPDNRFIRLLFYIRILSMGSKKAFLILKNETALFKKYFSRIERKASQSGKSKIIVCKKGGGQPQ
jgi:ubiquinone/menaquinone biosynthesis C-methylase UbiE